MRFVHSTRFVSIPLSFFHFHELSQSRLAGEHGPELVMPQQQLQPPKPAQNVRPLLKKNAPQISINNIAPHHHKDSNYHLSKTDPMASNNLQFPHSAIHHRHIETYRRPRLRLHPRRTSLCTPRERPPMYGSGQRERARIMVHRWRWLGMRDNELSVVGGMKI